jgi:hypothetical protein
LNELGIVSQPGQDKSEQLGHFSSLMMDFAAVIKSSVLNAFVIDFVISMVVEAFSVVYLF